MKKKGLNSQTVLEIPSWHPSTHVIILHYTYISSITPSAGAKSFEHTGPTGGGGGVAGAAGRGAAAVRYGF